MEVTTASKVDNKQENRHSVARPNAPHKTSLHVEFGAPAGLPFFLQPSLFRLNSHGPTEARTLASSAQTGQPSYTLPAPHGGRPIHVYETLAARQAADRMGAFGFAYQDSIFMGRNPGIPGGPNRDEVLRHEMAHVLQSRQNAPIAARSALERQASGWQRGHHLFSADPAEVYGFLWIPAIIAAGYILLKPNVANAPGPGDKTYKSMDFKDYGKMVAEAALFASGGLVTSALRKAGYSAVATWGISGAAGSVGYRGVQDIFAGSFSGIDAYVVDAFTGATIGVVVGGTFYTLGKAPGLSKAKDWFMRGAENDEAWAKSPLRDKLYYEIGQKTLTSADEFAKVSQLSPVDRGAQFVKEHGWMRSLFPSSTKFLPGTGGTFSTGPTPGARWFLRSATGFGAGATGNYLFGEDVRDAWGTGMESYGSGVDMGGFGSDLQGSWGSEMQPGASGAPVIYVVPEGEELNYLIKSGRVGDFPVPEGASGLRDAPNEFLREGANPGVPPRDMMG